MLTLDFKNAVLTTVQTTKKISKAILEMEAVGQQSVEKQVVCIASHLRVIIQLELESTLCKANLIT